MLQKGQVLSGEVRACEGGECGKPGRMVKLRILKDFLFTKTSQSHMKKMDSRGREKGRRSRWVAMHWEVSHKATGNGRSCWPFQEIRWSKRVKGIDDTTL